MNFKKIIEQNECTDSICFVTDVLNEAKNLNGFINELLVTNGFKFKVLDASEEIDCIYAAVINSFNRPKGVLLNISEYNTEMMIYNRRNMLTKIILPFGSVNITEKLSNNTPDDLLNELSTTIKDALQENNFIEELPEYLEKKLKDIK